MNFIIKILRPLRWGLMLSVLLTLLVSGAGFAAKIDTGASLSQTASPIAEAPGETPATPADPVQTPSTAAETPLPPEGEAAGAVQPPAAISEPEPSGEPQAQTAPDDKTPETEAASDTSPVTPKIQTPETERKPSHPARSQKAQEKYVTLDFDNVNIEVFVKFISELTGKNFIIDDKVRGKVTIFSPRKILLRDVYKVFLSVLEINGFATVPVGDIIKIVPSATAREKSVETRISRESTDADDRIVTQIIALERANPDEVKRVLDPIVSRTSSVLSYPPAGILIVTDYLSNIRRLMEIVKALDVEEAGAQITYLPLKNASASEVVKSLTAIFQQRRANVTPIKMVADARTNSVIIFASTAETDNVRKLVEMMDKDVPRGESNIQVYRLQNSVAEDLSKVLNSIIREGGQSQTTQPPGIAAPPKITAPVVSRNVQIVPDKATNALVIMAEREDYKVLENIIRQLDIPRAMVYIEALIMEVNTNKDFKLGVEWRGIKDTGSIAGLDGSGSAAFIGSGTGIIPGTTITNGVASLAFPGGLAMGILGAGIEIGGVMFPNIGAMVQAYKTDSEVSILSTPQLLTLDNEEAEINVGSNVPYLTRQDTTSQTTSINYNSYEYKDVGVILNITPHINDEGFIRLKLSQEVTKVQSGADKAMPTTLKRTAKTTVVVKDKATIVIGGLVGDSTDEGTNKVPFLGDVPLLGWLFKARTVKRERTNLYVFLTPHIVRTQQEAAILFQSKRETMGEVEEGVIKLDARKQEKPPGRSSPPQEPVAPANP